MDLEMPSSAGLWDAEVIQAVRTGRLPAEAVAASAQRVLDLVARAPELSPQPLAVAEHDALARRIAAEGTVLLTNDGILPLPADCSVAVIGAFAECPRYQGGGSSLVNPTRVTTVLDELRHRAARFTYVAGYDPHTSTKMGFAEAVEAARRADVAVVMVGLPTTYESEGFDRDSLDLPAVHNELVTAICAANPRTVVALSNGAPVRLPWRYQPAAIVESYLGGQASGAALVDVLYGDVEPGGRLAETFPEALGDLAATPWFPGDAHQVQYREGIFVGYRHHVTADLVPVFGFGHGLSYTTFDWTGISLDRPRIRAGEAVTVAVTVTNTGARPGSDVVQVYLHNGTDIVLRPRRQLAGFAKVRLAAGETQTVRISVPGRAFAYYDVVSRCRQVPSGRHQVLVAGSSVDIVATVDVDVDDGVTSAPESAGTRPVASGDDDFARRLGRAAPMPRGVRPFTRESTIEELATTPIGRLLRIVVRKAAPRHENARGDTAAMLLFERSVNGLPIRAAANFSHGALGWPTVDAIVALANGQLATAFTHALTAVITNVRDTTRGWTRRRSGAR